jgi:AraC family transcriptional regulator
MYFTQLPDHDAPGFDEQVHFHRFGKHNMIFNAFSEKAWCSNHVGCLSIKTVFAGEEWYSAGGPDMAVRPGQFLILNDDQNYSCRVQQDEGARTFSVFFERQFATAAFRDLLQSEDRLLDVPFDAGGPVPEFFQTLHAVEPSLALRFRSLESRLDAYGYDPGFVDEYLLFLLRYLVRVYRSDIRVLLKIDAVKRSTRQELFKRVCVARDILHSTFSGSPDLARVGREACLSMPQLIRHFKSVFGMTPHQYLMDLRLRQAARLLKDSALTVQEISWRCGYADVSAFCRIFKAVYGVSPERLRRSIGID